MSQMVEEIDRLMFEICALDLRCGGGTDARGCVCCHGQYDEIGKVTLDWRSSADERRAMVHDLAKVKQIGVG